MLEPTAATKTSKSPQVRRWRRNQYSFAPTTECSSTSSSSSIPDCLTFAQFKAQPPKAKASARGRNSLLATAFGQKPRANRSERSNQFELCWFLSRCSSRRKETLLNLFLDLAVGF